MNPRHWLKLRVLRGVEGASPGALGKDDTTVNEDADGDSGWDPWAEEAAKLPTKTSKDDELATRLLQHIATSWSKSGPTLA